MRFEFATATRILFGPGTLSEAASEASRLGRRPLVVTGSTPGRFQEFLGDLTARGLDPLTFPVEAEPTVQIAECAVEAARRGNCDLVIGLGGGSVLDTAKATAGLLANPGDPMDYLEIVGRGLPLENPAIPCIAIPTTAGTGSEVTRNAVLGSPEHRVKVSLRSPFLLPRLAIVDPELTLSVPPRVSAFTGLDALTQLLEAFISIKQNPLTSSLCREGLHRAAHSLKAACDDGQNRAAREDMALASLLGGLALANAGLGAVHGLAGPIGGMFAAPHGALCARLLPEVIRANHLALKRRDPNALALERLEEASQLVTGLTDATAEDLAAWTREFAAHMGVPGLKQYGISETGFSAIVAKARRSSSMKGNPIVLEEDELAGVLAGSLEDL